MSELKSMKIEPSEADKLYGGPSVMADSPKYPYGLNLSLDDLSLGKLGLNGLPKVGEKMMIEAVVVVSSVSAHDSSEGGLKRSMSLQITDLCLEPYSEEEKSEEKKEAKVEEMQQNKGIAPDAFYSAGPELRG